LSTYERLVNSQNFFSPYLTQEDLSRLGRNYIEVGRLTEEFFPNHDIRLVAVSDNIDTDEGENELAPIRNLFKNISHLGKVSNDFSLFGRF
jgi:site-specific DNA recombinase